MPPDDRSDRFARREELAEGVWLAYDELLGRDVVLKRAAPGEPRVMARLNHPHVITVYEHVDDLAVLEYAPGGSLAGRVLPLREAARVAAQIAEALVYMHGKGLVHCDVKPGNIVLTADGAAKLTDFGSAYHIDPEQTITPVSRLSYTPGYAAPELVRGSPVPASDVYSLAATVRALVGEAVPALNDLLSTNPHDRPDAAGARALFLALAEGGTAGPAAGPNRDAVPAQLPADVYGFTGRDVEIDLLDSRPAPVVAISGTAGVGKTTLAVHWAHRIAGRFPDGRLYVNLRGFDPSGQIINPADAIRGFLDAFGTAPEQIPVELDAQAALYRSILSTKRVLVVLDNARDAEQVRPLLPGNADCLAIVTSRNDLLGLVTKEGARPVTLDVLSDAEARHLLDQRLGAERTAAEPEAVDQIIQSCARLPLALAIVAAQAVTRPGFPLAVLTDALTGEDPDTDIRTVFSWSYRQLSVEAQRLFRLLGLHPGPDLSAPAAAGLAGGRAPLAELTRAHLVSEHAPGRYTFHDLLRAYATELAQTVDTAADRAAATRRMLDHYLHSANAADELLGPRDRIALEPAASGIAPERTGDYDQAIAWFTAESPVLHSLIAVAAGSGYDVHAWQLAWSFYSYLNRRGLWREEADIWQVALEASGRLGNLTAQARAHRGLAGAYTMLGRFDESSAHLLRAGELYAHLGDRAGQARTHRNLARMYGGQQRYDDALEHAQAALALFEQAGHRLGQAESLNSVGWYHALLGRHGTARVYCNQALSMFQELGDRENQANTWDSLAYTHFQSHELPEAIDCYHRALALARDLHSPHMQADILTRLGDVHHTAGDYEAAEGSWRQALALYEELGHAEAESVRERVQRAAPNRP